MLEIGKQYKVKTLEQLQKENYMDKYGDFYKYNTELEQEQEYEINLHYFVKFMQLFCGKTVTITERTNFNEYSIREDNEEFYWNEWMFDLKNN